MAAVRRAVVWLALVGVVAATLTQAAMSPLLAWRDPIYIAAGFAGIMALCLLLFQPLLAGGLLPGISAIRARRVHRWLGGGLSLAVLVHVGWLWLTSPPDVIDALLLRSPTPFSIWGVLALWSVLIAAFLVMLRKRTRLPVITWRIIHKVLAVVTVIGSVVHALKIEGTMGLVSKYVLCAMVIAVCLWVVCGVGKAVKSLR